MATQDLLGRIAQEIDERLQALRPAVEEHERLLGAATAIGVQEQPQPISPRPRGRAKKHARRSASSRRARSRAPRPRGEVQTAIVAALEHGSHTVSELVLVTAQSAPAIRRHAAALLKAGAVSRARREGKSAYTLVRPHAAS
jgi:regulatory ArsR family protein